MKLWSKEKTNTAQQIETFTVGNDRDFDLLMASHDVQGSIAHVTMLGEQGLMSKEEAEKAVKELRLILEEIKAGNFSIDPDAED
ncbi:MAG: argininosuccinate lyase, partial [Chitinophagia bacterium]|nr:argininosuccinate lyase [Chitinophagia bacterium]